MLCLAASPSIAQPEPLLEFVEDRGHYLLMNDVDGLFELRIPNDNAYIPTTWEQFQPTLRAIENGYRAVHRDNSRMLVTFTIPPLTHGVYHRPLANDVHGIGHAHWGTNPFSEGVNGPGYYTNGGIWDGTPNSAIQGIAYLDQWNAGGWSDQRMLQFVLGHEVGHAWLAFPWFLDDEGVVRSDWQDDEETHWSSYVDTSSRNLDGKLVTSPLGGDAWVRIEDGVFTWVHEWDRSEHGFSDLDLYLMGVLPPEQVEPFWFIEPSCAGNGPSAECSRPSIDGTFKQHADYRLEGTGHRVSVDDIIAVEGPRIPAFEDAPKELPVTFLVIKRPETQVSEQDKLAIEDLVQRIVQNWNRMTRGLFPMINRSSLEDETPGIGAFTCIEDANTMCLLEGRYQVRVQWRTTSGDAGLGTVVDFGTENSGLFWFFGEDNWEVMLKVLDACSFNDRYWVFAAATTDVEYTLTVTDTTTGESRRYQNPLGQRSDAVTDTDAFACL